MSESIDRPWYILPIIVFSQFAGTSLWFAGNAVIADLPAMIETGEETLGWMTSSVQIGFITGTFLFAITSLSDRYQARSVFIICAFMGALCNFLIIPAADDLFLILSFRFLTGFFLAGIYPVGMKICASWFEKGLGVSLGLLVGALVAGTSFPHLLNGIGSVFNWKSVLVTISILAAFGGMLMYTLVPDGPFLKRSDRFQWTAISDVFKKPAFRKAAFGYFGHMWELYAFWTFIPLILAFYLTENTLPFNVSIGTFLIIFMGAVGCVIAGFISLKRGSGYAAFLFLLISGICCLISPFVFQLDWPLFILFLLIWGFAVVADSAQFSTLNAQNAPQDLVGTGLTIVTSIGFATTIFSIELLNFLKFYLPVNYLFLFLLPGPILGLLAIRHLK